MEEKEEEEGRSPPVVAKRLWKIVKIMLYMIQKGVSKRRLMVDLHLMMKRSKIAGKKAIGSLMLHHHHNFSCHTTTDAYIFAPREYEFSCSNSPAFPYSFTSTTRRNKHHHHHYNYNYSHNHKSVDSDMSSSSSSPVSVLPGFGKSPMVRQLRITDSPFPLKESGTDQENSRVNKEAEEFIERFYEQLRLQRRGWP